jgi:DNA-binding beta-propeller fold protein YncE
MYLLANKDRRIIKCDATDYSVLEDYLINVLNPEGFDFDKDDNIYVTSDDLQRIYFFDKMTNAKIKK